jgi:hypothetical protein
MSSSETGVWILVGVLAIVVIIVSIMSLNNSSKTLCYPERGDYTKIRATPNLTYYYTISTPVAVIGSGVNVPLTPPNTQTFVPTVTQTLWSPLFRSLSDVSGNVSGKVGQYESLTEIYQTDTLRVTQEGESTTISCPLEPIKYYKNGLVTLVIKDDMKNVHGSINFTLTNKSKCVPPLVDIHMPNFINDIDDSEKVFEITSGTGDFIGIKGYIYVNDKLNDPHSSSRAVHIYYK